MRLGARLCGVQRKGELKHRHGLARASPGYKEHRSVSSWPHHPRNCDRMLQGTVLCPARAPQATWGGESLSQLFPFLTGDLSSLSLSSPESLCLHCCLCLWRKSLPNVPVFNLLTFSPPTWVKALVLKAKNGQIQFSGVGPLCSDWCILVWNC